MTNYNNIETIDLKEVLQKIIKKKGLYYKALPVVFVISAIYIFFIPRYYDTSIRLAPESNNPASGGMLGTLAQTFGVNLGDMQSSDAITPFLYPDLMDDNGFVFTILKTTKVKIPKDSIETSYYDYLKNFQKSSPWGIPINWVTNLFENGDTDTTKTEIDPYNLSKENDRIKDKARGNIKLNVDKKTGVITISVRDQDPLICKTIADSVQSKLQIFLTNYRTNKARIDMEYYKKLTEKAKSDYERARRLYGSYADANTDVILESFRSKQNDLENDMQLKYNTYTTLNTQLQVAKAKVQERTPAFTIIKGAEVPIKPSGPKRMIFVIGMLFMAVICTTIYILKDDFIKNKI